MLLKWPTSEYQLEYQNLPVAIRKQIWEENIKFREFLAENNRLQHFWFYQSLEGVTKQRALTASTTQVGAQRLENESTSSKEDSTLLSDERIRLSQSEGNLLLAPEEPPKLKSALKHKVADVSEQIPISETDLRRKDVAIQTPKWEDSQIKKSQPNECKKLSMDPCYSTNYSKYGQNKKYMKKSAQKVTQVQVKKTPFLSYGWNDCKKDVGSKRTFNIHASVDEIYPASLHALSRRRDMFKKADASRDSRPSTAPLLSPVNHSSLWMTEYQDIFSRQRPQSAPFASKSVRWH